MRSSQITGRCRTTGTQVGRPLVLSRTISITGACVLEVSCVRFAPSRAAGRERHVGERRRSSRCLPHHPAALPLGRPGQQRLGAHGGQTQIPDGGTVGSVDSATPPDQLVPQSAFNVSECLGLLLDARRQHEGHPPEPDGSPG